MTPEASLWNLVHDGGPWFWHLKSIAALLAMYWLIRLAPSLTRGRAIARIMMIFGLFMIAISSTFNSALGPLGDLVFFVAFSVGSYLRARQHVRAGIARPMTSIEIDRDWQRERRPRHP
jgi:hypothetical protein